MRRLQRILTSKILIFGLLIIAQIGLIVYGIYWITQWIVPVYVLLTVLDVAVVLYVINSRIVPAYKINWLIMAAIFPLATGILYLIIGSRRIPPKFRQEHLASVLKFKPLLNNEDSMEAIGKEDEIIGKQLRYIVDYSYYPVYEGTRVSYYENGEKMFNQIIEELKKATKFIYIEMFIMETGALLDQVLNILEEKSRQGVDVRIIYDDMGCAMYLPHDFSKQLASRGIKCQVFNPFRPILWVTMNNRDHRKIIVIDGNTGFTGGLNLGDEYINRTSPYGYWKDAGVMLKGPAVTSLTVMFLQFWQSKSDQGIELPVALEELESYDNEKGYVLPFSDSPTDSEDISKNAHLNMIWSARKKLYIMTPYFVVDYEMLTALKQAAKNGVDVRIILPHVPDKWYMLESARAYYRELISSGCKIYEYVPGFIHSKVMMADDKAAIVGTINMDYRSYYLNFECGVYLYKNKVIKDICRDFDNTIAESQLIDLSECNKIPLYRRLIRAFFKLFAPFM